jgi:hypothetical protein
MILSILDFLDLKVYNEIKDLLIIIDSFINNWGIVGGTPRDYFIYNKKIK